MLSIGNKKYRNLQEQVGFNTEQIEKIFETLDGLNIQDNVVIVSDLSTPLTTEELQIISREVAFIVYSGELYIKKSEDASNAYFDIVFTISVSGDVISFSSKEITVTLSNGALGLVSSTNSTYSTSHLDSAIGAKADTSYVNTQLALKANLAGANFTGAVTAPSITEIMTGYSFVPSTLTLFDIEYVYAGASKTGNKLTLVLALNITRLNTSSGPVGLGKFVVPNSVLTKLYETTIGGGSFLNCINVVAKSGYELEGVSIPCYIDKSTDGIAIGLVNNTNINNLTLNTKHYLRIEATFLLSDNLAS